MANTAGYHQFFAHVPYPCQNHRKGRGAALGIAIVKHFLQAGATTIATTHYSPLKIWASQADSVLNGSVEFNEQTLRPTFRLIVGVAGASAGLEIPAPA